MSYFCCDENRRQLVRAHLSLNGIDYLEVVHGEEPNEDEQQRRLRVFFVKPAAAALAARFASADLAANARLVKLSGGERVRNIQVDAVAWKLKSATLAEHLEVHVTPRGDFSRYTLSLVELETDRALAELDTRLSRIDFSFKIECPSDFDCAARGVCPPEPRDEPEIDYLAKDYASFRRLMLDRITTLSPGWTERNPADHGVALVELLAYLGDALSYRQDAVATEAYLHTARRRVSARRHARLVDYRMHDGCNARVWVQLRVRADTLALPAGSQFLTRVSGLPARLAPAWHESEDARIAKPGVFELLDAGLGEPQPVPLFAAHNNMHFFTFGDQTCCLPQGATRAALHDGGPAGRPRLRKGDVLIFQEMLGPETGAAADADPTRRHAVRLTRVHPQADVDRLPAAPVADSLAKADFIEIEWDAADALPFQFCISSKATIDGREHLFSNISVALGNVVLADHGRTLQQKTSLPEVPGPDPRLTPVPAGRGCFCVEAAGSRRLPHFYPRLDDGPLTQEGGVWKRETSAGRLAKQRLRFDPTAPASAAFIWKMDDVLPAITLRDERGGLWKPNRDLLGSDRFAQEFVAEVEADGSARLRFGDDLNGNAPAAGMEFTPRYRIGNGTAGNVAASALAHVITSDDGIESVTNPLPARGGVEPETLEEVRQRAPEAFRTQERAVTPADYAAVAERDPRVQRATAAFRWTGSWRTVFLTIDRAGGLPVDDEFEQEMRAHLERFRMAGHDVEIDAPRFVPVEIEMRVCVQRGFFGTDVRAGLLELFSSGTLADGRRGVFHPDHFTFGQPLYLSRIYAAAQSMEGVASVQITVFQRRERPGSAAIAAGRVDFGRIEIAQLENDPNFPEHGTFKLRMEGGR